MGTRITSLSNNFDSTGKLKAAGINNASLSGITALPSGIDVGKMTLLSTQTASSDSSISFTSGIDSTYDVYCFKLINIHLSYTSNADFGFQGSTDGGSNYNTTITSSFFDAYHYENDASAALRYLDSRDLAQGTGYQPLSVNTSSQDSDQSMSGELWLYNPSSTTYVKHFMATINTASDGGADDFTDNSYVAGYFNTTSAINAIDFKHPSGNIDDGTISLYGVSTS